MRRQALWRVTYSTRTGDGPYASYIERTELVTADTMEDALRLARTIPGQTGIQAIENGQWCWA